MAVRHFLSLLDLSPDELLSLLDRAQTLKAKRNLGRIQEPLKNKQLVMIFDKSSTRTRVSFESGMTYLGGNVLFLPPADSQLGRGEPIADSARVISSMSDVVAIRTFAHETLESFAAHSSVPVINALTDFNHPCQLLADMLTWRELQGDVRGKTACYIGDGNNMCHSWMNAAQQFGFNLRIATPAGYKPDAELFAARRDCVEWFADPKEAAENVHVVTTDVWASMGQEQEQSKREQEFAAFQVDDDLMARADKNAIFMHCLPAHRGEEVSAEVMDGPQSVVWQEAENRMHVQMALMELLIVG